MPSWREPRPQRAWLYTRGHDSVRLEICDGQVGFTLKQFGPGSYRSEQRYTDSWRLIEEQVAQETRLLALGYTFFESTANRRTGSERRRWDRHRRERRNV